MSQQMSLADALAHPSLGSNARLEAMHASVDWSPIAVLCQGIRVAVTGRTPYPSLPMLKALVLQGAYDLSDAALEEALSDRLSFRKFCGFGLEDGTPDATTILRFRHAAAKAGALAAALAEINRQFERKGLILKKGTLIDATLVAARHTPPAYQKGAAAPHPKEPDAAWTRKGGKSHFGYKVHIGADETSGLVRTLAVTPANINDGEAADRLISGDEGAVYADKAYEQKERRRRLRALGIKDRIMHRRHKHIAKLPHWQQQRNKLIAKRRAPVEAVFSATKRLYGLGRARYADLARIAERVAAIMIGLNLRRAVRLAAA